jgi:hypothetical protein
MTCCARQVGTVTRHPEGTITFPAAALTVVALLSCLTRAVELSRSIDFAKRNHFHILSSLSDFQLVDGTTAPKEGVVSRTTLLFDYKITLVNCVSLACNFLMELMSSLVMHGFVMNQQSSITRQLNLCIAHQRLGCAQVTLRPSLEDTSPTGA